MTHESEKRCIKSVFVLVCRLNLPILILLFMHSRKYEGVRKFVLEKVSYIFVYDKRKKEEEGRGGPTLINL
jgi:hypothetical protein